MTDERQIRDWLQDAARRADQQLGNRGKPVTTMLAQTISLGSYPTAAGRFFAVRPLKITSAEGENVAATVEWPNASAVDFVYWTRTPLPAQGDAIEAYLVGDRWVAQPPSAQAPCSFSVSFAVTACFCAAAGANVHVDGGGGPIPVVDWDCACDANGKCGPVPNVVIGQTYTYSVTFAPYSPVTGSFTVTCANQLIGIALHEGSLPFSPLSDFLCVSWCDGPVKKALNVSTGIGTCQILLGPSGGAPSPSALAGAGGFTPAGAPTGPSGDKGSVSFGLHPLFDGTTNLSAACQVGHATGYRLFVGYTSDCSCNWTYPANQCRDGTGNPIGPGIFVDVPLACPNAPIDFTVNFPADFTESFRQAPFPERCPGWPGAYTLPGLGAITVSQ